MSHCIDNNIFSDCQYGFRNRRGCTLQLLKVLDDWTKAIDNGLPVDTLYLDLQKAFDSVPHKRLIIPTLFKKNCPSVRLSVMLSPPKPLDEIQPNLVCELLT